MKICFYSPYLPKHFGGGEKHLFDVAFAAATHHEVFIALAATHRDSEQLTEIKKQYETFAGYSLKKITIIETPLGTAESSLKKIWWTKQFDAIYYVTDGSLFFSAAPHNYLHIQIPFTHPKDSLLDRVKLSQWKHINTNSFFTKKSIEKNWQVSVDTVLYPMVNTSEMSSTKKKQPIILNVGRFFRRLHSKRQDVLVSVFKELLERAPKLSKGWKLYLVGSTEDDEYVAYVKKLAEGLPVVIKNSSTRAELIELYESASMYWHATGFGMNEETEPEKVEHFGITTIEAMAAGVVPLVVGKGGQKEIMENLPFLTWETQSECVEKTMELLQKPKLYSEYQQKAVARAQDFDATAFRERVAKLFTV